MIRFEKKPDPQPSPKDAENNRAEQTRQVANEEDKKSGAETKRRRTPQAADDDRLI